MILFNPFLRKVLFTLLLAFSVQVLSAQKIDYLQPVPLKDVISATLSPVKPSATVTVPITTAGGDVLPIYADQTGFFKSQGLNISLSKETNFKEQVENCLVLKKVDRFKE